MIVCYIFKYIYIYIYINILYTHIYIYIYIRSICRQQLFRSLRAHQYSSDQMKILKDQSAQTTARVVSVAYCLWLPFLINRVLNLTILHPRNGVILYILPLCTYLSSNFIFVVPTLWKQQRLLTFRGI